MINYVQKYNITNLYGLTEEQFNVKVSHGVALAEDLVSIDDPNYQEEVNKLAIQYVQAQYEPNKLTMKLELMKTIDDTAEIHDEMLDKGLL